MKISVRSRVFETNSSSVHAIVIDTSGNEEERALNYYDGPELGYFGRAFKLVGRANDRLSYIWTAIWDLKTNYIRDDINEDSPYYDLQRRLNELPDLDWWKSYLFESWSGKYVNDKWINFDEGRDSKELNNIRFQDKLPDIDDDDTLYEYGWLCKGVDHADALISFFERIVEDRKLLYNFIFGAGSYIVVTNDEGGFEIDVPKMIDADIVMKSINDEEETSDWNRFHEFPEQDRTIFVKMG